MNKVCAMPRASSSVLCAFGLIECNSMCVEMRHIKDISLFDRQQRGSYKVLSHRSSQTHWDSVKHVNISCTILTCPHAEEDARRSCSTHEPQITFS